MPILNYTTSIPVETTTMEIQKILIAHNAHAIRCDYKDRQIVSISFMITVEGKDIPFKLPGDWRPVQGVLNEQKEKERRSGKRSRIQATPEQAQRVAWRIVKDWIEAQMALVEIRMVKIEQVFLPYAMTHNGQTMYELLMKPAGEYRHLLMGPTAPKG